MENDKLENLPRILLIDDDLTFCELFKEKLSQCFSITVVQELEFPIGDESYYQSFCAIIVDQYLPSTSGLAIIAQLQQLELELPCLFVISSDTSEELKLNSLRREINDILNKEMSWEEIKLRLEASIKERWASLGNLSLDLNRLQCDVSGKKINLTSTEFQILKAVLANKKKSIHKRSLFKMLWGEQTQSSNSVNSHIFNLNKKIASWDYRISILRNTNQVVAEKSPI